MTPGFTKVHVSELEDAAPRFGIKGIEARFAKHALQTEILGLSHHRVAPGVRQPFGHQHRDQEEVYVVLAGGGRMKVGDEIVDLAPMDLVRVAGPVPRQLEAGEDGLELIVFGAPISEESDATMLPGWWEDEAAV
jgi:mannose-6-phosphate isomerase-like protein (cupin superfamily)